MVITHQLIAGGEGDGGAVLNDVVTTEFLPADDAEHLHHAVKLTGLQQHVHQQPVRRHVVKKRIQFLKCILRQVEMFTFLYDI